MGRLLILSESFVLFSIYSPT